MIQRTKAIFKSSFRAEWPQTILLSLIFLLFICNALGLVEFKHDLLPGVDLKPEVFSAVDGNFILPRIAQSLEFSLLIISGVLLVMLLPLLPPIGASILVFCLAIPPFWMALAFPYRHDILPVQYHWLVLLILFGINVLLKYFAETQEKQKLLDVFSQFVPPQIVKELSHLNQQIALEGESRYLTVLFCDLRNFTSMSEQLDPKEVVKLLNEYFTSMTKILYKYGATIDKYVGDSIMAFWGAPLPQADHYERAVLASFEMHKQMESLATLFQNRGLPTPSIGIGINSGIMNVGNMGSSYRLAYTVIGDAVNLAFRLQSATRDYQVDTIVGENTAKNFSEMAFRELDILAVKGKTRLTRIYQPLCPSNELSDTQTQELALHNAAIAAWYESEFIQAQTQFSSLSEQYPDNQYYAHMRDRALALISNPTAHSTEVL